MTKYRQNYFDNVSRSRGRGGLKVLFYFACIAFPSCGLPTLLYSHRSSTVATIALVLISIWWLVFGLYGLMFRRDLFTDIAPFTMIPLVLIRSAVSFVIIVVRFIGSVIRIIQDREPSDSDFIPQSWGTAMANPRFRKKLSGGFTAAVGRNDTGVVYVNFEEDLHYLITGKSGNGKTTLAYSIILSLISSAANYGRWEFVLHDPKGAMGKYSLLAKSNPDKFRWFTHFDDIYDSMEDQIEEIKVRGRLVGESGGDTFEIDSLGLPQRLIVIDDHHLIRSRQTRDDESGKVRKGRDYMDMLTQLVSTGRQAGFHIVLITTYARGDHVDPIYRLNFSPITGWLPRGSGERTVGITGAHRLKKHEFLYLPDPSYPPIWFWNYDIQPQDIRSQIDTLLIRPNTPDEVGVMVFAQEKGCGWRRILTQGQDAARNYFDSLPFPFTEDDVRNENGKPFFSSAAQDWARNLLPKLESAGIAGPTRTGTYREFTLGSTAEALAVWRQKHTTEVAENG